MSRWPFKAIGEICDVNPRLPRGHGIADQQIVSFVPMAAIDEVSGTIQAPQTRRFVEVKKGYTHFKNDDVLFAKITPCMENGKAAIASNLAGGLGFGSTEFHVLRGKEEVLPEWLFYFVRQPIFRSQAKRNFTGTAGQQRVPTTFLSSATIPVPPLPEQRRIVDLLSRAESIVRLRREAEKKAAELIPALFLDMFGDPATNPKGWPVAKIGDLATLVTSGSTPRGGSEVYVDEGPYFIRSQNVLMNRLDLSNVAHITSAIHKQMERTSVATGDVLLNITGASIGRVAWVEHLDSNANVNQHVCIIRLDPMRSIPSYLSVCLSMPYYQMFINTVQAGASRQALNHVQVRSLAVLHPPKSLQEQFADHVRSIDSIQNEQSTATTKAQATFDALLANVFDNRRAP